MTLRLKRLWRAGEASVGVLYVEHVSECYALDLPAIAGKPDSAIPKGRYQVVIARSEKFGRPMPTLKGVPGHAGPEICWSEAGASAPGQIVVGETRAPSGGIGRSVEAFNALFPKLESAARRGEVWIEIE